MRGKKLYSIDFLTGDVKTAEEYGRFSLGGKEWVVYKPRNQNDRTVLFAAPDSDFIPRNSGTKPKERNHVCD